MAPWLVFILTGTKEQAALVDVVEPLLRHVMSMDNPMDTATRFMFRTGNLPPPRTSGLESVHVSVSEAGGLSRFLGHWGWVLIHDTKNLNAKIIRKDWNTHSTLGVFNGEIIGLNEAIFR